MFDQVTKSISRYKIRVPTKTFCRSDRGRWWDSNPLHSAVACLLLMLHKLPLIIRIPLPIRIVVTEAMSAPLHCTYFLSIFWSTAVYVQIHFRGVWKTEWSSNSLCKYSNLYYHIVLSILHDLPSNILRSLTTVMVM